MPNFWNFPAAVGGMINSINNPGLETFRGNKLESLTREICQNSLDAVKDPTNPVVVEFVNFQIDKENFPNHSEFLSIMNKCLSTWNGYNKKSEEFIQQSLEILNKDQIQFLRISDFNTRGLEGAETGELGTPWSALVKESGSSNKEESSGGSFGIGKSAPFINSNLRTLFYSSMDINGYESHIGVANLMSFRIDENLITLGNGYYTKDEVSSAIPGQLYLDSTFSRTESGTDIFVSAFYPTDEWENEIIKSVLFNYFITVYQGKLIVKVNGFEINKHNISDLINQLDDTQENQILKNYFMLLISDRTKKIEYPEKKYRNGVYFQKGEAVLYLMDGENLNRRVLMTRKTGMRLFEQKNISGSISFTGILMITGKNMNNIFKQMENPAHNEWSPERFEKNPKLAKIIYSDLRKFIREAVKENFLEEVSEIMDAVGLNDFLPNKLHTMKNGDKKSESLDTKIKFINKKTKNKKNVRTDLPKGNSLEEVEKQLEGIFGISKTGNKTGNYMENESKGGKGGSGISNFGGMNYLDDSIDGNLSESKEEKKVKKSVKLQRRYICNDKEKGRYTFFIKTERDISSMILKFSIVGEQSTYSLPIRSAYSGEEDVLIEVQSGNEIFLVSDRAKNNFIINLDIDYPNYCVMEVVGFER